MTESEVRSFSCDLLLGYLTLPFTVTMSLPCTISEM